MTSSWGLGSSVLRPPESCITESTAHPICKSPHTPLGQRGSIHCVVHSRTPGPYIASRKMRDVSRQEVERVHGTGYETGQCAGAPRPAPNIRTRHCFCLYNLHRHWKSRKPDSFSSFWLSVPQPRRRGCSCSLPERRFWVASVWAKEPLVLNSLSPPRHLRDDRLYPAFR